MNKKKAIITISCICAVAILLTITFIAKYLFSVWQDKQTEKDFVVIEEEYFEEEIIWMGVAEDGVSTCVIENVWDPYMQILPGESVFLTSSYGVEIDAGISYNEYSKYLLTEYRIEDGLLGRVVDITSIVDMYPDDRIIGVYRLCNMDGEDYALVRIEAKPEEGETIYEYDKRGLGARKFIYLNLSTGEMFEGKSSQSIDYMMLDISFLLNNEEFLSDNISEEFVDYFYDPNSIVRFLEKPNGCFEIDIEAIDLPHQNEELYSLFPELKNYIGQEGYYIHLVIGNSPSAEYLLRLLMEDGKEISFEHMEPISRYQSIDGQEHEVHSFEEYYQWKDIYWRDR